MLHKRDSLSSSSQTGGFPNPEVADWLWSFVVMSWEANRWALAGDVAS